MFSLWKNSSIRVRIFLITLTMGIVSSFTINYAVSRSFSRQLLQTELNRLDEYSRNTKNSLDALFAQLISVGGNIADSRGVRQLLTGRPPSEADALQEERIRLYQENYDALQRELAAYTYIQPAIERIHILGADGELCSSDLTATPRGVAERYERAIEALDRSDSHYKIVIDEHYQNIFTGPAFVYVANILSPAGNAVEGRLIIEISYLYINEIFYISCIDSTQKSFIMTTGGDIMCNNPITTGYYPIVRGHPELFERGVKPQITEVFKVSSALSADKLEYAELIVVKILPLTSIERMQESTKTTTQWIYTLLVGLSLLFSVVLSNRILQPINHLNRKLQEVQEGNLEARMDYIATDEFGQLSRSFNLMAERIKSLLSTAVEHEQNKSDLEFKVLQAQINPHFLYNTLDSIKWLASMRNAHSVSDMTGALIKLLKYNLSSKKPLAELSYELDSIAQYALIQKFRYGDCVSVRYDIEPGTESCMVLRFMLQPIVENSIIHGFNAEEEETCQILIRAASADERLLIEVIDSGSGIDDSAIPLSSLTERSQFHFSGIGLANIQSRIKLQFGEEYGMTIRNNEGTPGLTVSISLPVIHSGDDLTALPEADPPDPNIL